MKKSFKCALALLPALFCSLSLYANDGNEFNFRRNANDSDGSLLSSRDVVFPQKLMPGYVKNYFKKTENEFPKFINCGPSLFAVKAAGDTVLVARGDDGIVCGQKVSRNEFGIDRGVFLSPDAKKLAYYYKDESEVHQFPFLDISRPGGALDYKRYPMAGGVSEKLRIGVYDFESGSTIYLSTEDETQNNSYLTNVTWSPASDRIYVQVLDRKQQNMQLNCYDAVSGALEKTLLTEHSETWVEPQHPLHWIKGNSKLCIYSTDNRDGYWNLYLVNASNGRTERLTAVDKDVEYVANDGKYVYFTAPDFHPVNNYLWRVNLRTRKIEQLTKEPGWHSIEMSDDCRTYVDVWQRLDRAPESRLKSVEGKVIEVLKESVDPTLEYAFTEIDLGTVTSANGKDLNYYRMVKPLNFDPTNKYPLILYVYGGPHSQMVRNTFLGGLRMWEMYMAQRGYVVFVMDNRGTMRHGVEYEHSIYGQCGRKEMEDQMQALKMLMEIPWIDKDRIGVDGWSYGGFMTLSLATEYPEIFKVAVAGGPVIDWRWYEVMYGERYMGTPQNNPEGYSKTSLLDKAKKLKAKTLIIEGGNDDTVVPLHALSFLQECIDSGIQVDYFTYPKAAHNMRGSDRVHLVNKISDYFFDNL